MSLWADFEVLFLLITPKVIAVCENLNQHDAEHIEIYANHISCTAKTQCHKESQCRKQIQGWQGMGTN